MILVALIASGAACAYAAAPRIIGRAIGRRLADITIQTGDMTMFVSRRSRGTARDAHRYSFTYVAIGARYTTEGWSAPQRLFTFKADGDEDAEVAAQQLARHSGPGTLHYGNEVVERVERID